MKTILIIYVIAINLIGFFLMGIDKRKAVKKKWRVSERTLFLIAFLFGSIGVLTGMYLFHHKTRKLRFSIGIPALLVVQLLTVGLLFSWNAKRMGSPSQAVQHELELIRKLDTQTIQSFVSYENLTNSSLAPGNIGEETAKAVELFFQNFKYQIQQEEINGDLATVSVNITNIDMQSLARDLCTSILKESSVIYRDSSSATTSDYYRLLRDTLSSNSYETTVTTAYFHLKKDDVGWMILADAALEDELVSGFISYMNDPHILSASEVLSIQLAAFRELTPQQWIDYLEIEDVFATYNTDYYAQIDEEYAAQLSSSYDFEVFKCKEDGNTASALVRITSVDMPNVLSIYRDHLLAYAATTRSIRDDDVTFSNETARLLLQSLQENTKTTATDVELTLRNDGETWQVQFEDSFTNALMGNMEKAIQDFSSSGQERATQVITPEA